MKKPVDSTFPYVSDFLAIDVLKFLQASSQCYEIFYLKIRSVKTFCDKSFTQNLFWALFEDISSQAFSETSMTILKIVILLKEFPWKMSQKFTQKTPTTDKYFYDYYKIGLATLLEICEVFRKQPFYLSRSASES